MFLLEFHESFIRALGWHQFQELRALYTTNTFIYRAATGYNTRQMWALVSLFGTAYNLRDLWPFCMCMFLGTLLSRNRRAMGHITFGPSIRTRWDPGKKYGSGFRSFNTTSNINFNFVFFSVNLCSLTKGSHKKFLFQRPGH